MAIRFNAKEIFEKLYDGVKGQQIADSILAERPYFYMGHIYGEITFDGFKKMLAHVVPKRGAVFYDLGSGTGKPVIAASLIAHFSKLVGVEIVPELHEAAKAVLSEYKKLKTIPAAKRKAHIQFINADLNEVNFSDADIIFINATCLQYELGRSFFHKLSALKPGTRIITNTHPLLAPFLKVTYVDTAPFTWGDEPIFIHQKI